MLLRRSIAPVVLAGSTLLCATGCSLLDPNVPALDPLPTCVAGPSTPLTPDRVESILRRHGFTVHRLMHDDWCGPDRAVVLSNQADYPDNVDESVDAREGWYTCVLYKRSQRPGLYRNLHHGPNAPIAGAEHAEWDLENLSCSLYPSSSRRWDAETHAFDDAIAELAGLVE